MAQDHAPYQTIKISDSNHWPSMVCNQDCSKSMTFISIYLEEIVLDIEDAKPFEYL